VHVALWAGKRYFPETPVELAPACATGEPASFRAEGVTHG
jgi:hypothetical protein